MTSQNNRVLAPEDQRKTFTIGYPEYCLLIDLVSVRVGSPLDMDRKWTRLLECLVPSQEQPGQRGLV